jgi:DNA-binding PadR family transcriptional regulator
MLYITLLAMLRRRTLHGSWLQLLLLRVIYEQPTHGYKLLDDVNVLMAGRRKLKAGSLYTILRRMEQANLLKSEWKSGTGPNRRMYTLTTAGLERLKQGRSMVKNQLKVLEKMTTFYRTQFREEENE